MDLRFENWHVRYRIVGRSGYGVPPRAAAGHGRAVEVCADCLDDVFGPDPTVYVLRRVRVALAVNLAAVASDEALARRWGNQLARAIGRAALAPGANEDDGVATFADEARFAAEFLAAVVAGRDPSRDWRFAPLASLVRPTFPEMVDAVLRANRVRLSSVLRELCKLGVVDRVVTALPPATAAELWAGCLPQRECASPTAERPLFAAALAVAAAVGWEATDPADPEAWFREYTVTRPPLSDWASRSGLTEGVLRAVQYLAARGHLKPTTRPPEPASLAAVAARYDWLNWEQLLRALTLPAATHMANQTSPGRRGPTPRARRLMDLVRAAVGDGRQFPVPDDPAAPTNALFVLGVVAEQNPELATDETIPMLIEQLLREIAVRVGGPGTNPVTRPAGSTNTGERTHGEAATLVPPGWIDCEAAGVALLFRAVLDLRLSAVVRDLGYPPVLDAAGVTPISALLLSLGLRWAGGTSKTWVDPGLAALAGIDRPVRFAEVTAWWERVDAEAHRAMQSALLRLAARHGLAGATPLRVTARRADDGFTLVGGDPEARVWVLGERVDTPNAVGQVLERWAELWPTAGPAAAPEAVPPELDDMLAALTGGQLGYPAADLTLILAADLIVRAWARWLRRFERAGTCYLLDSFIRRPGRVVPTDTGLLVDLPAWPLDPVLRLAGYTDSLARVPWLGGGSIRFVVREG